jgi:phosphate uptake regulator
VSELRKVQQTPGGTFFVCLPKAWAERYRLKRGSVVAFRETSDGKLLIDPEHGVKPSLRVMSIKPGPYLSREILGAYLLGFDIIRVEAKEHVSFEIRDVVKKSVRSLVGLEIVEEDYSKIILQCLLEPSSFPPDKILRRSYAIVAGMHRDVIKSFVNKDVQLAKSVIVRDDESNRLYFLLVRILRTIIQNPNLSDKLGISPIECIDYRLASSLVEAIGDECVRIALKIMELEGKTLTEELKKMFINFHTICYEAHENALKAFFSGNITLAENVRGMRGKIDKAFADVEKVAREQSLEVVPQTLAIASFLRQVYEHSVDIADLVMPKKA